MLDELTILELSITEDLETLDEAPCRNDDNPADYHSRMRCCSHSALLCGHCLTKSREAATVALKASSGRADCIYCQHPWVDVYTYDEVVAVVPV